MDRKRPGQRHDGGTLTVGPGTDPSDKTAEVRWGIASTGNIARQMAAALRTLPATSIVAVGSRSQSTADDFATEFEIPCAYPSHSGLCADPRVDVVYIASPHNLHAEMTIEALDAGKHVVCEKPFAINATQAQQMIDASIRNDRFLMEAMWTWFIPAVADLKRRIQRGDVGEIITIDADFSLDISAPESRHRLPELGGGALLDLGIYPLTFACHLLDEHPSEVRALGRLTDLGIDATVAGVASYSSGALSTFRTSIDGLSSLEARIVGTAGRIDVAAPFWFPAAFTVCREGAEPEHVELAHDGLVHEAAHAMEQIRLGRTESDVVPLHVTLQTMDLLDEIRAQIGVVYPVER